MIDTQHLKWVIDIQIKGVRWFNLPNTTEVLEKFALEFDLDRKDLVPEPNIYRRKLDKVV